MKGNNTTENILEASLRLSTHCKYNNYVKQWTSYSKNIGEIEVSHVLDFLSGVFDKGHAYSRCRINFSLRQYAFI